MTKNLVVGADVGGTNVKYVLVDSDRQCLAQDEIPTDPADPQGTIARLADTLRSRPGEGSSALAGVGLACAGIVSRANGTLGRSPNLPGWQNSDLFGALRATFGPLAFIVANDVNAALYGEFRFGAGRGCRHLVMIALGTGVGGGVIVDRQLVTGHGDGAGEIGHMTLQLDGPPCPCGNRGCLESYCGSVGLLREARRLGRDPDASPAWRAMVERRGDQLTTRDCHELAARQDRTALGLFHAAGQRLGQAVASLVNVLAPDRVIIGGGVAQAGDLLLAPCRAMVATQVMSDAGRLTPVVPAELGPFAAAMGAAALAAEAGTVP
ncbi:MAG TPA: ROK family protein [Candidatus Krumholzibacteria bacterium]|nr:ROK family protein [Candidatus Krumholzibacteria bacterium]HPD72170.1 ROK family protein [Candidatus Krumholzibacteria bacterium]HRY40898.1 ROK family protein [Candidatus Krumholzibacteria bacterium]